MNANDTNNTNKKNWELLYPELSYAITGILFSVHNDLGPYAREKQYGDKIVEKLKRDGFTFERELCIKGTGNVVDIVVERKIALELKAKRIITKEDYYQVQRYLQESGLRLGLLINFRDKYIKPKRIVRINPKV